MHAYTRMERCNNYISHSWKHLEKDNLLARDGNRLLCLVPFHRPQSAERLERWLQRWHNIRAVRAGSRADAPGRPLPVLPSSLSGE